MSTNQKDNMKNTMCYIPLVSFILFFIEKKPSEEFKKHMKYWMILFWWYFISSWILQILFLYMLTGFLSLGYIVISVYLWIKAYNWEDSDIEILDNISENIEDKFWKK